MPALFGIGVTLALERDMGLLRLKRAQPAPPAALGGREDRQRPGARACSRTLPIVIMALAAGKLRARAPARWSR